MPAFSGMHSCSRLLPAWRSAWVGLASVAGLGAYVAIALGYATIHQATVRLGLWRCLAESLDLSNLAVLEQVSAAGDAASPIGEGLADALGAGGV